MPVITDTEVVTTLIENQPSLSPGLKEVACWDPATQQPFTMVVDDDCNAYGEPTIVCPGCTREIDPTTCHCGTERERHDSWNDGHSFVPYGCICGYDKTPLEEPVRDLTETTDLPWDL